MTTDTDHTSDLVPARSVDISPLNAAPWTSAEDRASAMAPVLEAWAGSLDWTPERLLPAFEQLAIDTVRHIVGNLPDLPHRLRISCYGASTLTGALEAVEGARTYAEAEEGARQSEWKATEPGSKRAIEYYEAYASAVASYQATSSSVLACKSALLGNSENLIYPYMAARAANEAARAALRKYGQEAADQVLSLATFLWTRAGKESSTT